MVITCQVNRVPFPCSIWFTVTATSSFSVYLDSVAEGVDRLPRCHGDDVVDLLEQLRGLGPVERLLLQVRDLCLELRAPGGLSGLQPQRSG